MGGGAPGGAFSTPPTISIDLTGFETTVNEVTGGEADDAEIVVSAPFTHTQIVTANALANMDTSAIMVLTGIGAGAAGSGGLAAGAAAGGVAATVSEFRDNINNFLFWYHINYPNGATEGHYPAPYTNIP